MIQTVLIICVGNICRSPIAEALFLARLKQEGLLNIEVCSAGLAALVGRPADDVGQALMLERDIDLSKHRAQQVSTELLYRSDLILTMSSDQQREVESNAPGTCGRVHRLGKWSGYDVPDPYQRPKLVFEQAVALIEQGVDEWYRKLWN